MARELKILIVTLFLAFGTLVFTEVSHYGTETAKQVQIDKHQALAHIQNKIGVHVTITFEQELSDKYYFKVMDPQKDSIYDVYVTKYSVKPQLQSTQALNL